MLAKRSGLSFPADLYVEGTDQHRGWFQSSLLTSIATKGNVHLNTLFIAQVQFTVVEHLIILLLHCFCNHTTKPNSTHLAFCQKLLMHNLIFSLHRSQFLVLSFLHFMWGILGGKKRAAKLECCFVFIKGR